MWVSSFPASFVDETIVSPLCILGILIEDQVTINSWIYFWAHTYLRLLNVPGELTLLSLYIVFIFCDNFGFNVNFIDIPALFWSSFA